MKIEQPAKGRAIITDTFNGLEISIPAKKNYFAIPFLLFWLCGWAAGELFVISILLSGEASPVSFFLLFWLCAWSVGGFFALNTFLWLVMGKEILVFDRGILTVSKKGSILKRPKMYEIVHIENLHVAETPKIFGYEYSRSRMPGIGQSGPICFDYGMKTMQIGEGVDKAEARHLIALLVEKNILSKNQVDPAVLPIVK